jgi:putative phosphoesterase
VLQDSRSFNIDSFLFLGDFVGYYYWPAEVLKEVRSLPQKYMIQGNHERLLKDWKENKKEAILQKYGKGIQVAFENLSVSEIELLINLPKTREIVLEGKKILLCHGSPNDPDKYIYPSESLPALQQCFLSGFDFIFMGHTHYPFCTMQDNTMLANPGSVGQPRDIGNLASYLIVDLQNKTFVFRRVLFDPKTIIQKAIQLDSELPYLHEVLLRNTKIMMST